MANEFTGDRDGGVHGKMAIIHYLEAEGFIPPNWRGGNIRCPLSDHEHDNARPGFSLFRAGDGKWLGKCHKSCGWAGDVIALDMALHGGGRKNAQRRVRVILNKGTKGDAALPSHKIPAHKAVTTTDGEKAYDAITVDFMDFCETEKEQDPKQFDPVVNYIATRLCTEEIEVWQFAEKFFAFAPPSKILNKWVSKKPEERSRFLAFSNRPCGIKWKTPSGATRVQAKAVDPSVSPKSLWPLGTRASQLLFIASEEPPTPQTRLFITEGAFDALSMHRIQKLRSIDESDALPFIVVGLPSATTIPQQLKVLAEGAGTIYYSPDRDDAGQESLKKVRSTLNRVVWEWKLPEGIGDITDYLPISLADRES